MLRVNLKLKKLEKLSPTELTTEKILEKFDLQALMVRSWDDVKNEIGLPTAFLIGQEIRPHESTQDAIDLLAYNQDDSSLVVIELKRHKNKLQLLQALSYGAMVSSWDPETLLQNVQDQVGQDRQELREIISDTTLSEDVKIVLVAEGFDPEVILTSDWLSSKYDVDITAFAISLHKIEQQTLIHFEQRYPLKELADVYDMRAKASGRKRARKSVSWEEVLPKLKYAFAEEAIELCRTLIHGDPSRRRFGNLRTNFKGFKWISLNLRDNYINVYTKVSQEEGEAEIRKAFGRNVQISPWRDGVSFLVHKEQEFRKLVKWLEL